MPEKSGVGQSEARPPIGLTLIWCPVCGRDDRYKDLRQRLPHRTPKGSPCPGKPIRLSYVLNPNTHEELKR